MQADMTDDLAEMNTILILESDKLACRFIHFMLQKEGFRVLRAPDVHGALPLIQAEAPHLVIVDLTSRETQGSTMCRELRSWYSQPVLVLSTRLEEQLAIDVLDAGADIYVNMPFKPAELLARIRALLRSPSPKPQILDVIRSGDLEIDFTQRRVFISGKGVRLTRTEFLILAFLARNHDHPVSIQAILEAVWGPVRGDYMQSLRVHIGHIRRKIEPDPSQPTYLLTRRGGRYQLSTTGRKFKVQGR